jgi:hypothetical protein
MAFGVDELDLCGPDILVCAGAFIGGRRRSERSANGFGLLNNWSCSADCEARAQLFSRNVLIGGRLSIA